MAMIIAAKKSRVSRVFFADGGLRRISLRAGCRLGALPWDASTRGGFAAAPVPSAAEMRLSHIGSNWRTGMLPEQRLPRQIPHILVLQKRDRGICSPKQEGRAERHVPPTGGLGGLERKRKTHRPLLVCSRLRPAGADTARQGITPIAPIRVIRVIRCQKNLFVTCVSAFSKKTTGMHWQ